MFRTRFCFADLLVCVGVALVASALLLFPFLFAETGERLVITTPTDRYEYRLDENRRLTVESGGITLEIVIENGKARVAHATCPDGVCYAGGEIFRAGQSILCAPAGVTLLVEGGEDDVDFIAG